MTTPIPVEELPGPRALPLIGNLLDLDAASPFVALMDLAKEYGPIVRLVTPSGPRVLISGADLVDEICDDTRFDKKVAAGVAAARDSGGTSAQAQDWRADLRAHDRLLEDIWGG